MPDEPDVNTLLKRLLEERNAMVALMAQDNVARGEDVRRLAELQCCIQAVKETQLMLASPGL